MLRSHGWTRDVQKAERFEDEYQFLLMGYNLRGLEMHAAIAREQLRKTQQFQEARLENWQWFEHRVADLPITLPTMRGTPNPFGLHFLCEREADRGQNAPLIEGDPRIRGMGVTTADEQKAKALAA